MEKVAVFDGCNNQEVTNVDICAPVFTAITAAQMQTRQKLPGEQGRDDSGKMYQETVTNTRTQETCTCFLCGAIN